MAEGQSAADALILAERHPLDLMLLDLEIAGRGAETVLAMSRLWPAVRLVALTNLDQEADVAGALRLGVSGYILKSVDTAELVSALRTIATGGVYLTPSLGARLLTRGNNGASPHAPSRMAVARLTPREDEILAEVSVGATNKEIAKKLKITEKTVKYFMTNIMQKLHVRNRVEAVVAARSRYAGAA